ncbi:MAG: very short patch repair endonuclease [Verrucomicrobiia bacterium]
MADVFTRRKRSAVMAAIPSRGNKETECSLLAIFRKYRIVGWRRHLPLPGQPDFAFPKSKVIVFVDGCFWHGCPRHFRLPRSNISYWRSKISRNKRRDSRTTRALRRNGWKVLRVWQHQLADEEKLVQRILTALLGQRQH